MSKKYTDGIFDVSSTHGFLPIRDPLDSLPDEYIALQKVITDLPSIITIPDHIVKSVEEIPDYTEVILSLSSESFILQALFRAYTFIASAYTLELSYQVFVKSGQYGPARRKIPANIARPLVLVAERLKVYPWLDYHYAYSLGNYVKYNPEGSLDWKNLGMACSFTGGKDEVGFIMLHVYINELSPFLVEAVSNYRETGDSSHLASVARIMKNINDRRKEMWEASRHERYNDFRIFIMGIKGNTELFGDGVVYEGCYDDQPQQFRGQTGAQDNIIPMMDIFTGVVDHYPQNKLTEYLLDLRSYRPVCIQDFLSDLRSHYSGHPILSNLMKEKDVNGLVYLLQIVEQIYLFRNGHFQFVIQYIMANTKYEQATGGTPIISWLPNQIHCVLTYGEKIIEVIDVLSEEDLLDKEKYQRLKEGWKSKRHLLTDQVEELNKKEYNVKLIYEKNKEYSLEDHTDE
jgi:indoleamine 2,3-dioxygenase